MVRALSAITTTSVDDQQSSDPKPHPCSQPAPTLAIEKCQRDQVFVFACESIEKTFAELQALSHHNSRVAAAGVYRRSGGRGAEGRAGDRPPGALTPFSRPIKPCKNAAIAAGCRRHRGQCFVDRPARVALRAILNGAGLRWRSSVRGGRPTLRRHTPQFGRSAMELFLS